MEVEGMDPAVVAHLQMMVITGGKVSGYVLDNAQDFGCQNVKNLSWNCFLPQMS